MVESINFNVWTSVVLFLYGLYCIVFKNQIKKRAKAGWLDYYFHRNWPDKVFYIMGAACIITGILLLIVVNLKFPLNSIISICVILILLIMFFGMSFYYNKKAKKAETKQKKKQKK